MHVAGKEFWPVGWFATINGTFSFTCEYLLKPNGGEKNVLARRKVGGSKGHTTLSGGICVIQPKLPDTVSGIYMCNTVEQ